MDRLMRMMKKWLLLLFAAVFALSLFRQGVLDKGYTVESLLAIALLGFVFYHLARPVVRVLRWWRQRRPSPPRPELPTQPQWVTPREQRRRTHDLR